MAEDAALDVRGLTKRYPSRVRGAASERDALLPFDLVLQPGDVHGLLGPNGAGKSTLLRLLLGLVAPSAGVVRLLGSGAGTAGGAVAGFCDTPRFYPYLSGRRNLLLLAQLDALQPPTTLASRIDELLAQVGLTKDADAKIHGYSAGMRQRLGLASALLRSPRLLLLDEPTSSIDPAGARELRANVRALAASGVTVLLSSHDLAEVEALCSSVTILRDGGCVFSGPLAALRAQAPRAVHRMTTSDDAAARALAEAHADVTITPPTAANAWIDVAADAAALDQLVIALGRAGIAVRSLEQPDRSLEALVLGLTATRDETLPVRDASMAPADDEPLDRLSARGVLGVVRIELTKLGARALVWVTLGVCLLGPFAFVVALSLESTLPEDTLFGRFAKTSGYAVPLVVLGFATAWALPALTSVVGGDLFASEDRYGTWPTLLTRSRTRQELFCGKTVTALLFSLVSILLTAMASIAAGVLLIGNQSLIGLSGTTIAPGHALSLVALSWLSVVPPAFAFTGLAILLSVATRSSAAGIGLPVLAGFAMQLTSFVNVPELVRRALLTTPFGAWHGLLTEPPFHGPLLEGSLSSALCLLLGLSAAWALFRRREFGG